MVRELKVYRWLDSNKTDAKSPRGAWVNQTSCIVAAHSKAEVGRITNEKPSGLFNLSETGNAQDIATALSKPGVVFWKFVNEHRDDPYREGLS